MCPRAREYNNLFKVIVKDVLAKGKLPILLLIFIVVTGLCIVLMTQKMRFSHTQYEALTLEKSVLDREWAKLILEEKRLTERGKIENIAVAKLNMKPITSDDETIVMLKK